MHRAMHGDAHELQRVLVERAALDRAQCLRCRAEYEAVERLEEVVRILDEEVRHVAAGHDGDARAGQREARVRPVDAQAVVEARVVCGWWLDPLECGGFGERHGEIAYKSGRRVGAPLEGFS